MNPKTPRIAALVAAPLLVVVATAIVMVPRGDSAPSAPSADGPTVTFVQPEQGAILPVATVQVVAVAEDPDGIAAAELRVDDDKVASALTDGSSRAELRFSWAAQSSETATLRVRARDNAGKWGEAVITVSVGSGLPPLPPPPTTAFATTTSSGTTTTSSSTTTTAAPTTVPRSTVPPPGPTTVPTTPATPPPTQPTLPPPTEPPTSPTTTEATTTTPVTVPTTTEPPTTLPTAPTTATPVVQGRCRLDSAVGLLPLDGASAPLQPTLAWTYTGSCLPATQVLRVSVTGGGGSTQVVLAGSARSYRLAAPLSPCARVRWDVVAIDVNGRFRGARSLDFTTEGC